MPSSVCPNSVCFGNISVLDSNSKINKSLSKKFLITVALVFSFKKTYKCKPPLFDFTGMIGKKPIFAAGMKMIWGQVAEGWVIATQDVWDHPLSVAKAIKKDFAKVARKYNIKRVQTAVRSDFNKGIRFAEWLGLKNEGLMKHYGFDGSDQYRYARIF